MADKLKEIPGKILEWWNKFTSRQKTIIIMIAAAVVFTFVIIIYTFTKPDYTRLGTYENTTTAAEIVEILDGAGITHRESADARTVEVLSSQLAQANLAIASEGYIPDDLKYNDYVETGMSTTSADRNNQTTDYWQKYIENMFSKATPVKDVSVKLTIAQNTGRLTETKQESHAYIQVTVTDEFNSANAMAMAKAAATCIGNDTTAHITIVDQNFNILFAGGEEYSTMGIANSMQELQSQAALWMTNEVKKVLLGTKQYPLIEVASHLDVDFSNYTRHVTEYYTDSDNGNGHITHQDLFNSETTNGVEGVPGTDSNGEDLTGYVNPDYSGGTTSSSESSTDYQQNVSDTVTNGPAGSINYGNSSLSVSMIRYREYYEENVERQGLLDGISWEDFKEENRASIKQEVDAEFFQLVANASGISEDRITIVAYEEPVFYDKEGFSLSATDITSIVMIILILALLLFVVLRSMGPRKKAVEEEAQELPVEEVLQSTQESTVEDIDVEAKSETRKMVEKFVDENPEAAASLLRNWLNEDWN